MIALQCWDSPINKDIPTLLFIELMGALRDTCELGERAQRGRRFAVKRKAKIICSGTLGRYIPC